MRYAIKMVLDTSKSRADYSEFNLLIEEDLSSLDLSGFIESGKDTQEIELQMFESCPYIKLHKSFEKITEIDKDNSLLERILTFSIEDTFTIRQQLRFLYRYQFMNYKEIEFRLLEKLKNK